MRDTIKKSRAKRKILIESCFVFFIAISPFLYKLYDYLPENPEATFSLFGFTIDNNGFPDISTYVWFMMGKIIPLYLLVFWFLTSKDWWYHIILIPIAMYSFQVFEVLFDSDDNIDTENIWWIIPICMGVIPFVYFIRIKLYDKYVNGIDLEAMEAELQTYREKGMVPEKKPEDLENEEPVIPEDETLSQQIDRLLSTRNLESHFKQLQDNLKNWLHLKS
ncbi:hypothetical protein D7Z94_08510 [Ulvibacterium marinum]|uniref:Uncharacterized protein n=1 Tax=Ulvibacterium marinum TaxID=2419782 RepID=A0A3B0C964_9FLAO|nr:hypothetical protein D7Z94_08510 [Ulvibacterium marinum]